MSNKIKFELEFPIHASPSMLYQYFGTPSGLSEWFADNVNSRGEIYTFIWDGSEEQAKVLQEKSLRHSFGTIFALVLREFWHC